MHGQASGTVCPDFRLINTNVPWCDSTLCRALFSIYVVSFHSMLLNLVTQTSRSLWTISSLRWSEDRLRELLGAVDVNRELDRVKITEVEKLKGEAIVNNRKAKLIYLYDWTITGKWQGYLKQVGIRLLG